MNVRVDVSWDKAQPTSLRRTHSGSIHSSLDLCRMSLSLLAPGTDVNQDADIQHGQRHPAQIGSQRTKASRRRQPQTITDILRKSTSTQSRLLRTGSLSEDPSAQDRVRSAIE